ncbi:InlB B-repeat-containing protein [Methylococcus mesophilus]|uniref:InlB B-repeat-containing protein n=1 Tax=Methylococcus mesophilus TaxID=2993564 RepID=UPI00224AA861|nr:hypothetical protein [Methylococcus mesophilus]UZR29742.1 hypothetical protein OOT43_03650 [Methylococcus mesophilus]
MGICSLRGLATIISGFVLLASVSVPVIGIAGSAASGVVPAGLGAAVREAQHDIQFEGGQYAAVNQQNQLALAFDGQSIDLVPSGGQPGWRLGLWLEGYGIAGRIEPVGRADVAANGRRLEYRRGAVTEWYENRDVGVEQGFTLARPPRSGEAAIELRLGTRGGLQAVLGKDGKSAEFRDASGRSVLDYRDLSVVDAHGKALPAYLKADGSQLTIAVDTRDAAWPIVVDPLIVRLETTLTAPDSVQKRNFGQSVAVSGDTAVVGAPFDTILGKKQAGSAYVFIRKGAVWSLQGKLTSGDDTETFFGGAVAIDGDTLVVGAPGNYPGSMPENKPFGAAYVFKRIGTRWLQKGKLIAWNRVRDSGFGRSVSISGDTVATVAWGRRGNATYVFVKHEGQDWTDQSETAKFSGGRAVALSGDTLAVGIPDEGAIRVYVKPEGGWTDDVVPAVLRAADLSDGIFGYFGIDIGISANTIVTGATFEGDRHEGAVYVFEKPAGGWVDATQTAKLTMSDRKDSGQLGQAVAISGDTVVATTSASINEAWGAAYFYTKPSGGWVDSTETIKELNKGNCFFGMSAAIAGDSAVVSCSERAYVYRLHTSPAQVPPVPPGAQRKKLSVIVKGQGTVTSDPRGIDNCDSVCSFDFSYGTGVNLTAEPEDGYMFSHWINGGGLDCYGHGTCWLLLDRDRTVTAKFIKIPKIMWKH